MLLLKLIRKLGKLLRGGATTRQIVLGAFLGVLIGMTPGVNLTLLIAIFLLLLLNAHVGIAFLGIALGKIFCLLLSPITFQIGYVLIHKIGLEGIFRVASDTPVLALLDLHVYCLVGGLPIAVLLGFAFAWTMFRVINGLRVGIVEAATRSEKMQKLAQNKLVRFLLWLTFGSRKEDLADMLKKDPPLLRKSGVVLASVVVVVILALDFLLLDGIVKAGIETGLTAANGAEVNVGTADVSLLSGKLELGDIQVTDSSNPTRNLVQVDSISTDMSISDLLAKRYVLDLVEGSNVRFGVERKSPGKVFREPEKEAESIAEPKDAVAQYFDKAEAFKEYLKKVKEYLDRRETAEEAKTKTQKGPETARMEKDQLMIAARELGFLPLSAKSILAKHPTWLIRKLVIDKIVMKEGAEPQKLEGSNLSSHPELCPESMALKLSPSKGGPSSVALDFHFEKPGAMHGLKLALNDVSLGGSTKLSSKAPVDVEDGSATIHADGGFSNDSIRLPFELIINNLKGEPREGRSILGLDPKTSREVLRNLEELKIYGTIEGALNAPLLKLDEKRTLASLKDALLKAGKSELANRANAQLQQVKGEMTGKVKDALKGKLPGGLTGGLGKGILGFGKKNDKGKKEGGKKAKKDDLLKKLFK